jgi:exosortase E/protease (VPEID-CTERM system)
LAAIGAAEGALVVGILRIGPALHSHLVLIVGVAFGLFLSLGHSWLKAQREDIPFGSMLFAGYLLFLAIGIFFRALSAFHGNGFLSSHAAVFAASPLLLLRIPLLLLACIPFRIWVKTLRATSSLWLIASVAGVAAWALDFPIRSLYQASSAASSHFLQVLTFRSLEAVLRLTLPGFAPDPTTFTSGTAHFSIVVIPSCSGMEGLGLVLVFTTVWLWHFRKECRFPQAFLLVPFAMGCIWLLNIVRLSILIAVGDAISPEIALVGIHSHVGWIAFIIVALTFFLATQRLAWVRKEPSLVLSADGHPGIDGLTMGAGATEHLNHDRGESPAIRAYLVPFLAILAASFVSKSASGYFEWLYPLRFVAAVIALCYFWPGLKKLNWRFGWVAPLAGVAVFAVWIAPSLWVHQRGASPLGPALAALSPTARWAWIVFRVAAAVITVPIAEELAFRGYLARRFVSQEFDQISFSNLTVLPVALSSAAFGLMHMQYLRDWRHLMLGTLAGLAYAAALRWRGRLGDAVVAHAITNLLLAACVLGFGDWSLW